MFTHVGLSLFWDTWSKLLGPMGRSCRTVDHPGRCVCANFSGYLDDIGPYAASTPCRRSCTHHSFSAGKRVSSPKSPSAGQNRHDQRTNLSPLHGSEPPETSGPLIQMNAARLWLVALCISSALVMPKISAQSADEARPGTHSEETQRLELHSIPCQERR